MLRPFRLEGRSAGGDVNTGNILASTGLVFGGAVSCVGGSGAGTSADPYIGATECLLPFGTSITTKPFSHYTVQAADFNLPGHSLTDTVTWNWNNTCVSDPDLDCTTGPQVATAGSSTLVQQLNSSTTTDIHNGAGQTVTTVEVGTTVHDFVTVTGQPNNPAPSGNVNIDWFLNGTCAGVPAVNSGSIGPLDAAGHFDATGFAFTPPAGFFAFKAHYEGDATYTGSDGPCEPLRVVDANIQITPQTAQNPINTNHTLTGHVNVNDGTGFTNAPDGTVISFSILSGPGSFVGPNTCTTSGGTGSCTAVITSGVAGTTTVRASTSVAVGGIVLNRATGDGKAGDSADATKDWFGGGGLIAPTQTTCQDFLTNTAQTLTQINYSVVGGKIGQGINPGVFFFYTKITTTVPNQVVTVSQSNTSTNNAALFGILNGQAWLWTGDCSSKTTEPSPGQMTPARHSRSRRRGRTSSASSTRRSRSRAPRRLCRLTSRTTSRLRSAATPAPRCC